MADRQQDAPNWPSITMGILTMSTILAAATSAGVFAVSSGLFGTEQKAYPEWLKAFAAFLATTSLLYYGAALFFGMAAIFWTQESQRGEALKSAISLLAQAFTAILAVFLIIFGRLF